MGYLRQIVWADCCDVQHLAAFGVGGKGIVDREQHTVGAEDLQGAKQGRGSEIGAGGDIEIGAKIFGHPLFQMRVQTRQAVVGTDQRERKVFAHMADKDLELWETVE